MDRAVRKICLLGDYRVGKTRLACRLTGDEPKPPAFGVRLHDWHPAAFAGTGFAVFDVAGRSSLDSLGQSFLSGADGFALVADRGVPDSIQTAVQLLHRATELIGPRPAVLMLNKSDQGGDGVPAVPVGLQVFPVSAVSGAGVEAAFLALAEQVMQAHPGAAAAACRIQPCGVP